MSLAWLVPYRTFPRLPPNTDPGSPTAELGLPSIMTDAPSAESEGFAGIREPGCPSLGSPASPSAGSRERRTVTYHRSEAVKVYVLRRADGICEGCQQPAPFRTKKGRPYLEPHHIRRVADGGPDDPRWVAALCPNCHREVHHGEKGDDLNRRLAEYLKPEEDGCSRSKPKGIPA